MRTERLLLEAPMPPFLRAIRRREEKAWRNYFRSKGPTGCASDQAEGDFDHGRRRRKVIFSRIVALGQAAGRFEAFGTVLNRREAMLVFTARVKGTGKSALVALEDRRAA